MGAAIQTRWTDERVDELRRLFAEENLSAAGMAALLGVSRSAVIGKLNRLGLRREGYVRGSHHYSPPRSPRPKAKPRPKYTQAKRPKHFKIYANGGQSFRGEVEVIEGGTFRDLPADESPFAVHLFNVKEHQCRWPLGEPAQMMFCGDEKVHGCSYCARHAALAFGRDDQSNFQSVGDVALRLINKIEKQMTRDEASKAA